MALHLWADNRITHSIAFPGQTHYNNADFSWVHLFLIFYGLGDCEDDEAAAAAAAAATCCAAAECAKEEESLLDLGSMARDRW